MTSKLSRSMIALLIVALMSVGQKAAAHSFPEEERPSAGQTLPAAPPEVTIKFDAPIEKLFAKVQVLDADGKDHALGAPTISSDGIVLTAKVSALTPGDYQVKWNVVCIDTHHTEGSYSFTVSGAGA
jgi:methionine-rich copper-binding protein CopC